jgi:hypothetical protein
VFEVTLSHILPNGTKKYKSPTLDAAKKLGDTVYSEVKIPGGRNGAAPFRIIVLDGGVEIASRELPAGEWKDVPKGFQDYPKWVTPTGREPLIVHTREEEERVLAEAPAPAPAKSRRGATV